VGRGQALAASAAAASLGRTHIGAWWSRSAELLGVALGLRLASALLNDANPHLINFYRWIRRGLRIEEGGYFTILDRPDGLCR